MRRERTLASSARKKRRVKRTIIQFVFFWSIEGQYCRKFQRLRLLFDSAHAQIDAQSLIELVRTADYWLSKKYRSLKILDS